MPLFLSNNFKYLFQFIFLFLLESTNPSLLLAQKNHAPHFSTNDSLIRLQLAEQTASSIQASFLPPTRFNKVMKNDYLKKRDNIVKEVSTEIAQLAIPDAILLPFLEKVHKEIIAENPFLKNTQVILLANPTPNAYSIGNGTFVVHVGLLAGLENEDQLAFVLCHEIAHYVLAHTTKDIEEQVEQLNSKAFKEKIKKLEALEYNRSEQIEAAFQNMIFNNRYHSRNHERQADSLAYYLYTRTKYETRQSERLMEVFGNIDEPFRDSIIHFDTRFGCPQQPFYANWLAKDNGSIWEDAQKAVNEAKKVYRDSISTHPDWQKRLLWLRALIKIVPQPKSITTKNDINYANIRYQAAIESVAAWASFGRYDRVLFLALQYQNVYPECHYFKEMECWALYQLYQYTKNHEEAKVLAQSADKYPEKYNQFLDFLNTLRMKELLGLANCSAAQLPKEKGEYGLLATYYLALEKEDKATADSLKKEYNIKFTNGKFAVFFKK